MFFWGLVITSVALGHIYTEPVGWLVFGIGCMGIGILHYLNGTTGPFIYIGSDKEKYEKAFGCKLLLRKK